MELQAEVLGRPPVGVVPVHDLLVVGGIEQHRAEPIGWAFTPVTCSVGVIFDQTDWLMIGSFQRKLCHCVYAGLENVTTAVAGLVRDAAQELAQVGVRHSRVVLCKHDRVGNVGAGQRFPVAPSRDRCATRSCRCSGSSTYRSWPTTACTSSSPGCTGTTSRRAAPLPRSRTRPRQSSSGSKWSVRRRPRRSCRGSRSRKARDRGGLSRVSRCTRSAGSEQWQHQ